MSNTITLPDNISFEEIALKWCSFSWESDREKAARDKNLDYCERYLINFVSTDQIEFWTLGTSWDHDFEKWEDTGGYCGSLNLKDRNLEDMPNKLLDYIKERSNV